jgi:hypothetical protein
VRITISRCPLLDLVSVVDIAGMAGRIASGKAKRVAVPMDERTADLFRTTGQLIRDAKRLNREHKRTISEIKDLIARRPPKKRK